MASRVNVKFVVGLSVGVVLLMGGVGYSAITLLMKSAADHAKAGDAAAAKGDWRTAEGVYSKAVSKEQTNAEYTRKWRDALEHIAPETPVEFNDKLQRWFGSMRQLAIIQRDNVDDQRRYLDARRRVWLTGGFNRSSAEAMVSETETVLALHASSPSGPWEVLKRYRGLARLRLLAETPDAKDSAWADARADLEAALKADPTDSDSAVALEALLTGWSDRAEKLGDKDKANELDGAAKVVFDEFLKRTPDDPIVRSAMLRRGLNDSLRKYQAEAKALQDAGKPAPDATAASKAFIDANRSAYEQAFAGAMKRDPKLISVEVLQNLRQMEATMEPATAPARTQELLRRALEASPKMANLLALRADFLAQQENFAEAVEQLQAVLDVPPMAIGLEGAELFGQKSQARFLQTMWSIRAAMKLEASKRGEAVEKAKGYYERYNKLEEAESKQARLAEAWLAFLLDDIERSDRLFENLVKSQKGMDADSYLVWAQVAMRRQQPGAARDRLTAALRMQPQNINAAIMLAELHLGMRELPAARDIYQALVRMYPDKKEFRERLAQTESAMDPAKAKDLSDPVEKLLFEVDAKARKERANPATDKEIVDLLAAKLVEFKYDPRIVQSLAMAYRRLGDTEKAAATLAEGSAKNPDNKELARLKTAFLEKDDYLIRRKLVELSDSSDLEKALAWYSLAREYKKDADAAAAVEQMGKVGADDVKVLEVRFIEALGSGKLDEASSLADTAAKLNADKYEGRTFKARVLGAKSDYKGAAELMQEVVNTGGAQPEAFRLLARFQQQLGRNEDALNNFRVAQGQRPNDPEGLKDIIRCLVQLGRTQEALTTARNGAPFGEGDAEFGELWLRLEQQVGDAAFARARRERMANGRPNDRENLIALGDIYLRLNDTVKAAEVAAKVKALEENLESVALEAAVAWASNKRDDAKAAFVNYAAKQKTSAAKLEAHLVASRFLYSRGDAAGCMALLEAAREFQDPKVLEADKAMLDAYLQAGTPEPSLPVLRRVIAALGDGPQGIYRKRLVEALFNLGRFDESEAELEPLLKNAANDHVAALLRASILGGKHDAAGQRRALDDAVARFPKEPAVFIRRGQFLADKDETLRDGIADFSQAAQLAPNLWQVYRLRAGAYARVRDSAGNSSEIDRAIDDLKRALQLNPFDNDLLVGLVADLLRLNRDQEARKAVDDAVKARPRDAVVYLQMGNLFGAAGRPKIAQEYFKEAFTLDKSDGVVQRYLDALLNPAAQDLATAEEVLTTVGEDRVSKNAGFLMARARILMKQSKLQQANRVVLEALRLLDPAKTNLMMIWFQDMQTLQPDVPSHVKFLEAAINQNAVPGAADWMGYFRASLMVELPDDFDTAVKQLESLAAGGKPQDVRLMAARMLGGKLYASGKFDRAEAAWREALKTFPQDAELNNNLAYMLAVQLNRCQDAIPFALAAAAVDPKNADVADTLAFCYFKCGKLAEAVQTYRGALENIRAARTGVHMLSHLAEAEVELSKQAPTPEERQRLMQSARDHVGMAENILGQKGVQIDDDAKGEYARVKALVGK